MKITYVASTALAGILAASPALSQSATEASAQEQQPSTTQAQDADENEIIVTAQKRVQNVQDVPLSVTAISGETLTSAGVSDISTLEKLAPGLQFGQSGNDARPAIRGARTESISNQTDPIVSFFVDGIYRSRTSQALAAFVDLNRVEVLRGPQGTLYGRNSFGGAINLISNRPVNDTAAGAILTLGNYSQVRVESFVNVPLTDSLFARFSGSYDAHDPYVRNTLDEDNGLFDKDDVYLRGQLRWEPFDGLEATLRGSLWRQGGNGASDFGYFVAGTPIDPNGGTFTFQDVIRSSLNPINPRVGAGRNTPADAGPYRIARDARFDLDTDQRTLDLEADYDFGPVSAKLLLGYADFETFRSADADLSIQPSGYEYQLDTAKTFTQELQLTTTGTGPLQLTAGAYHLTDETLGIFAFDRIFATNATTNLPILTTPAAAGSDFNSRADVDTDSLAFYGQGTFSVTEALRVTGGIRWTRDEKDFSRQTNSNFTDPLVFAGTPFEDSETFEKVTYRGAAEYDITHDNLVYASVATGFQAGGFNNSANTVTGSAAFGPQNIRAYELGSKNRFGPFIANLALYWNNFEGLLANQFINVGSTVLTVSANAGAARARGAELELAWRPSSSPLSVTGGVTYNDAKFKTYVLQEPVTGLQQDLRGQRVPFTPDWTARIGGEYEATLGGGASLTPSANLYYSSSFSTNDFDYDFGRQDGYAKLDLGLTYRPANGRWWLQAFGNNVTDEAVITRTIRFGQNAIVRSYAAPATYGVRLGLTY